MKTPLANATGGAAGGLIAALLLTFVLPSDHDHGLSSLWTDHLHMFILLPVAGFVGGWFGSKWRGRNR